jgi:drug/metabolite transporter (DMT)-like permease
MWLMSNHTRAIIALVFTIFVWGVAPAFVRSFSLTAGPADAIVIRMWFTALSALPLLLYSGWHIDRSDLPMLFVVSIIGMFGYFLGSIFGYAYVPAGFGSMIIAVQPLLIALIAAMIGADRLTLPSIAGLIISFVGSIYLFAGNAGGGMKFSDMLLGGLLLLGCDIAWAIYVIFSKPLLRKYGTLKISAITLVLCALPSLAFISGTSVSTALSLDGQALFSLFFLSVIGTVICMVTWNFAVPHLSSTTMGASLYLIPVLAVLSGWAVLHEKITTSTLIAGAIILAGVAVAEFGSSKKSA